MTSEDHSLGLRILIADDEFLAILQTKDFLEELGCEVVAEVGTIAEIVPAATKMRPDCALLDVNLRGHHVYPAAEELRAQGCPVILLTGYTDLPEAPPSLSDVPRLSKPLSLSDLRATLKDIVSRSAG